MKTLLFISLMLFASISQGTNHYISATGSDANTGLTPATAWQSIAKVNAMFSSFSTGDSILFKRRDTFYGALIIGRSGISGCPMVIAAYGTGAKPLLFGSRQENLTTDWVDMGGNIWQNSDPSFAVPRTYGYRDVANIIFNNEASCGVKLMTATPKFTAQGQFWFDYSNNRLSLYSSGNPASVYTNIQCAFNENAVTLTGRTYITFKDLDFRYWGRCVWESGGSHITWQDVDLSYIGGSNMEMGYTGVGRFGNGLQIWQGEHDVTIERCNIDNIYDAGISPQGYSGGFEVYNIYMRNNVISNCEYCFEFYERGSTSNAHHIYFENNTCVYAGGGWSHGQRPDGANGSCVRLCDFTASKANIFIRNNIFYSSSQYLFQIGRTSDLTNIVLDYNSYYTTSGEMVGYKQQNRGYYYILATWKAATDQDAHSISDDPLFISATDFHLQTSSPAINAGVNVGLTTDMDGVNWNNPPSLGAYEYPHSSDNNPPSIQDQGFQLNENSTDGTSVGTLVATDPDAGQTLTYSIVSGNTKGAFAINALTGVLSVANGAAVNVDFALVVKVQDNGVGELSSQATITINIIPTGIELTGNNETIKVYPNPVSDELIIEIKGNKDRPGFEILNSTGQIVFEGNLSEKTVVQTTNFSPGVYLLKIENHGSFEFMKMVKV